jgi:ArsR family transcriptional regulator
LDLKKVEKISKALGDPCRLSIIDSIRQNRDWLPCTQILEENKLAQSTISHHLKLLVDAELLIAEKEGRNTKYLVNKEMFNQYSKFLSGYGD